MLKIPKKQELKTLSGIKIDGELSDKFDLLIGFYEAEGEFKNTDFVDKSGKVDEKKVKSFFVENALNNFIDSHPSFKKYLKELEK